MKNKGSEYSKASRKRKGQVKTHDMNQSCVWASNEKSRERVSKWKTWSFQKKCIFKRA